MHHDPAWLRLHDGHAHGGLADDPVYAHSGIEPSAGHTDQQNRHRRHSDAAQSHVSPARTDTSGSASLTRPNHPKAALPIDQRVGPAGSCTGGFRTQAPETLHNLGHSSASPLMTDSDKTRHFKLARPCAGDAFLAGSRFRSVEIVLVVLFQPLLEQPGHTGHREARPHEHRADASALIEPDMVRE